MKMGKMDEDRGELLSSCCTSSPASEPVGEDDEIIALCSKCKDWADFIYENDLDKEDENGKNETDSV
tara:strand:- start:996 stop:1196 length:201 start_codon:yes stop_codon:yes gene_type:complete